jgi:phosphohistidine swiveling domain-containing protein
MTFEEIQAEVEALAALIGQGAYVHIDFIATRHSRPLVYTIAGASQAIEDEDGETVDRRHFGSIYDAATPREALAELRAKVEAALAEKELVS